MTVRTELWGLGISGALCWLGFALTVVNSNPAQGQAALLSFYISLFIAVLTTLTIVGYFVRRYLWRNELKYRAVRGAFRQGFIVAALLCVLLVLQAARLLSWWDILLLVVVATLLELYLRSYAGQARL